MATEARRTEGGALVWHRRTGGAPGARGEATPASPTGEVSGLTKTEAEELLDWLEGQGRSGSQVSYDEATGFTVRCP